MCVGKLSGFLEDEDQNRESRRGRGGRREGEKVKLTDATRLVFFLSVKYIALLALVKIIPTHAHLLEDYQEVVLKSVDDADLSIRLRALDLVQAMVRRFSCMLSPFFPINSLASPSLLPFFFTRPTVATSNPSSTNSSPLSSLPPPHPQPQLSTPSSQPSLPLPPATPHSPLPLPLLSSPLLTASNSPTESSPSVQQTPSPPSLPSNGTSPF